MLCAVLDLCGSTGVERIPGRSRGAAISQSGVWRGAKADAKTAQGVVVTTRLRSSGVYTKPFLAYTSIGARGFQRHFAYYATSPKYHCPRSLLTVVNNREVRSIFYKSRTIRHAHHLRSTHKPATKRTFCAVRAHSSTLWPAMNGPSTPSRAPPGYGDRPPAYFESSAEDETPPTSGLRNNSSSLRLLPQTNDSDFRPYVTSSQIRSPNSQDIPLSPVSRRKPVGSPQESHVKWKDDVLPSKSGRPKVLEKTQNKTQTSPLSTFLEEAETAIDASSPRVPLCNADHRRTRAIVPKQEKTSANKLHGYNRAPRISPDRYPRHSGASSIQNSRPSSSIGTHPPPPVIPPPSVTSRHMSPERTSPISPIRPNTPSRGSSDWSRPPPSGVPYEPQDINGSPRPGTPSSRYSGSPRRPLPPAPLFAGGVSGGATAPRPGLDSDVDDAAIPIPDDPDDPFAPAPTGHAARPSVKSFESYQSESTFTDEYAPEDPEKSDLHYGPAPSGRQDRRGARKAEMTKKEVRLINGELILECKIPTILHSFLPRRDEREFTHMRYTAVTCDPDDFCLRGYKLRQNIGSTMRETELLICVTMYNENEIDFTRTMHGIMRNISHFCSRSKSRTWGKDGWQKIVVCIISDGRRKVHPRTLNALAAMGVYQDGIAKNIVNQKEVTAHVYEYTTQVSLDPELKFKGAEKGIVPCQMIFCLKEKNQKKLNSHRWFFNAFGRALTPNVCVLLDVGTKPDTRALYHLWKAFDQDSSVAGAAGEIKAGKGKSFLGLLNPLVASQNFEYKMSNILDKPLESVFGYITVLPGALSAYRYYALQNDASGHGPLSQYFKGETLHGQDADVFTANMYLAEDRILCWELVAKRDERWVLKFVKSAVGETDVPGKFPSYLLSLYRFRFLRNPRRLLLAIFKIDILTDIDIFRCGSRIHLPTPALAQRCLLRRRLFPHPLSPGLAYRPHPHAQDPAPHRVLLPIYLPSFHLLLFS